MKNRPGDTIIQCGEAAATKAPAKDAVAVHRPAPPSPCIKTCTLDAQGYCAGCLRTGEEIARWLSMSAAEQWRLIEELAVRRKLRGGAGV